MHSIKVEKRRFEKQTASPRLDFNMHRKRMCVAYESKLATSMSRDAFRDGFSISNKPALTQRRNNIIYRLVILIAPNQPYSTLRGSRVHIASQMSHVSQTSPSPPPTF